MPTPSSLAITKRLLATRRLARGNRWRALSSSQRTAILIASALTIALICVAGFVQRGALLAVPDATTLPAGFSSRGSLVPGAAALDLAFWISTFCSAIFSFRIMEFLFRDAAIRSIDDLPLPMVAFFVDRLARGLLEALALGVLPALFFLPLLFEDLWVGVATLTLCVGGPLLTLGAGVGVQLFFGGAEFGKGVSDGSAPAERRAVDGYGGAGQLFLFAPAAALAASVILVMLLKLSLGELVRLEGWNRATSLGVGIGIVSVVVSMALGWSYFKRAYFRMLAGFREADFVGFDLPIDYQTSDFEKPRAGEGLLPVRARDAYRRTLLQYGRRFAVIRYLYGLLWLLALVALFQFEQEALPISVLAALPCILLATLANPSVRVWQRGVRAVTSQPGRLAARDEDAASALVVARESALFLLPFGAIILAMIGWRAGDLSDALMIVAAMLLGGSAQSGCSLAAQATYRPPPVVHYPTCLVCALVIGWACAQSLLVGIVTAGTLTVVGWIFALRALRRGPPIPSLTRQDSP